MIAVLRHGSEILDVHLPVAHRVQTSAPATTRHVCGRQRAVMLVPTCGAPPTGAHAVAAEALGSRADAADRLPPGAGCRRTGPGQQHVADVEQVNLAVVRVGRHAVPPAPGATRAGYHFVVLSWSCLPTMRDAAGGLERGPERPRGCVSGKWSARPVGRKSRLRPTTAHRHPGGRRVTARPERSGGAACGLTPRPTGWFHSVGSGRDRDTLPPMDTHAAVRMLTAAGAAEALAVAVIDVAENAAAEHDRELTTRSDLVDIDQRRIP